MKKSILFGALSPFMLLAMTPTMASAASPFDGFYSGLSLGGTLTSNQQNINATGIVLSPGDPPETITANTTDTNTIDSDQLAGALFFGYGHTWRPFYLGTELFITASNPQTQSQNSDALELQNTPPLSIYNTSVNTTTRLSPIQFGLDLRPGVLLQPGTLLYGRLGVAVSKLSLDSDASTNGDGASGPLNLSLSTSKVVPGLRLGAGIEQRLSSQLSVRADYIYTYYGRINTSGSVRAAGSPSAGEPVSLTNDASATVSTNTVMLGLSYSVPNAANAYSAAGNPMAKSALSGWYAGFSAGGMAMTNHQDTQAAGMYDGTGGNPTLTQPVVYKGDLYEDAFKGAGYAGYGRLWQPFYLGAELFVDGSDYRSQTTEVSMGSTDVPPGTFHSTTTTNTTRLSPIQYGVDLRPGVMLQPGTLLYGRAGVAVSRLSLDSMTVHSGNDFGETWSVPLSLSSSKTVPGLRLGVGLEQSISPQLSLRADYIYSYYGRITASGSTTGQTSPDSVPIVVSNTASSTVSTNTALLGFTYHFLN